MTWTGLALGLLALGADGSARPPRIGWRDVALGLGSAAGLYGIFKIGDRVARCVIPGGAQQIDDIYSLGQLRHSLELATRLGLIIGPAEELFWRGFVLRRAQQWLGRWAGAAASTAAYGGAHFVTGNVTLIGAAAIAGAYWSALAAMGMPMAALIVSHSAWDIWVFLVAPTATHRQSSPGFA